MSLPFSVLLFGGGLVGLRMVRGPVLKNALHRLSNGQASKLWLPRGEFEIPGKLESLQIREPSLATAFTAAPLLIRRDAQGKIPVLELATGLRRARRLLAIRQKGPNLQVVAVASPSDVVNLLTIAAIVAALGVVGHAQWPFWTGMGLLLAIDGWMRLHVPVEALKRSLERLGAGASRPAPDPT